MSGRVAVKRRVAGVVATLPDERWRRMDVGAGSKGPRLYDWAHIRLPYDTAPGCGQWLLVRRAVGDPDALAYYRVFGPEATPLAEMARVAGRRWVIEEGFARAKGEVGRDQYEVRRWEGWHRHITLGLLAHAFLDVTRAAANEPTAKKGGAHDLIPLTTPEVRRLLRVLVQPVARQRCPLDWSCWRRHRQAEARGAHYERRAPPPEVPL